MDEIATHGEIEPLKMKIADAISAPIEIDGHTLVIGASIGSALHPSDAATLTDLLQRADVVMYRHKSGQNTLR